MTDKSDELRIYFIRNIRYFDCKKFYELIGCCGTVLTQASYAFRADTSAVLTTFPLSVGSRYVIGIGKPFSHSQSKNELCELCSVFKFSYFKGFKIICFKEECGRAQVEKNCDSRGGFCWGAMEVASVAGLFIFCLWAGRLQVICYRIVWVARAEGRRGSWTAASPNFLNNFQHALLKIISFSFFMPFSFVPARKTYVFFLHCSFTRFLHILAWTQLLNLK